MFVICPSSDFWVPGVYGSDLGNRKCSLGERSGCSVPEFPSLGPTSGQLLVLGLPVFLVLCHHPQHSRTHLPLCQVSESKMWREKCRNGGEMMNYPVGTVQVALKYGQITKYGKWSEGVTFFEHKSTIHMSGFMSYLFYMRFVNYSNYPNF